MNCWGWILPHWLGRGAADVLAGRVVVVGITGGVAAHYLPELIGHCASGKWPSCTRP